MEKERFLRLFNIISAMPEDGNLNLPKKSALFSRFLIHPAPVDRSKGRRFNLFLVQVVRFVTFRRFFRFFVAGQGREEGGFAKALVFDVGVDLRGVQMLVA